ncbi:MAG: insulinase family protein [Thermodesulfovibrionales bacterium]|nr:insulinase family protein [Thermodesulfovibrionales bacterium]
MKKFVVFLIVFFLPSLCNAQDEVYLDNGLKVIFIEDNKSPIVTFQIWYKVGSRNEPLGKTGISHLLEHMMFKGTKNNPSKKFSNIIQKNGGIDNAFTTRDYTMYFQTLPSNKINLSIELEADRMRNLLLKKEDVESEKMVVMEERRLRYEDDPQSSLLEEVIATAIKFQPYRWPIIGWMSDISSITKEDLYEHYRKHYCPENSFIVISGDVKPKEVLPMLKENFGKIKPCNNKELLRQKFLQYELEQKGEKRVYLKKEAKLPYLLVAYHVPSFPQQDNYALEVLSVILSSGKSSRLYREIVYNQKLAVNVFADYYGLYLDPFLFFVGATAMPNVDIETLEKSIYSEIEKLKREPPTDREIQKAKNKIESSFIFSQDSNFSKGLYTGIFELHGDRRLINKYLEGIREVTKEDIKKVINKYFIDDNKTVGILIPVKKEGT